MRRNFRKAVAFVMKWEGSTPVRDTGGLTRYGISEKANPDVDILNLTREEAERILLERYWEPAGCDLLPWPMDVVVFDTAVNVGVDRARAWLSGYPVGELHKLETVAAYLFLRLNHYISLARYVEYRKYLRGWVNRVISLWDHIHGGVS